MIVDEPQQEVRILYIYIVYKTATSPKFQACDELYSAKI